MASWAKLKNGEWGVRVEGDLDIVGLPQDVTSRGGVVKTVVLGDLDFMYLGPRGVRVGLFQVSDEPVEQSRRAARSRRRSKR